MLAHGRLRELIPDPRPIAAAAAVAKATTALTNGLSATNQKPVLMLFISSTRRPAFQKGLKFFLHAILPSWFASKIMPRMKLWSWQKENLPSIRHSVRTALAATASVIVARLVQMPEAYWAAIATLVVMQSSLGATLTLSIERVVATALGASVGAVEANYFGANLAAFMLAIFFIGLLSFCFRLERTAYRYASVTLTIIVLIPRTNPAWIVALHRFIEVSVGIIVALIVVGLWPERSPITAKNADQ